MNTIFIHGSCELTENNNDIKRCLLPWLFSTLEINFILAF